MTPDLKALHTFQVVARTEGFSAAGRELNLTAGAVSRIIAKLEQQLGVRLFNRTTTEFNLTEEGQEFLQVIGPELNRMESALLKFRKSKERPQGHLRVSLTNTYGKFYVLPKIGKFMERYPEITLDFAFNDFRRSLVEQRFDVGTSYGPPDELAYFSRVVCRPQTALVASPDYLRRCGVPRRPSDLYDHSCVNVKLGGGEPATWTFSKRESAAARSPGKDDLGGTPVFFQPHDLLLLSDQIDGVAHAAMAGIGITVVHVQAALPFLRTGALKTILNDYEIDGAYGTSLIYAYFPHREGVAPRVRAFVDFLANDVHQDDIDINQFAAEPD